MSGKDERKQTWEEKTISDLANYGYQVIEFKEEGVLCKTRNGVLVLLEYSKEGKRL